MMRSSTPLKKEISAVVVLITQLGLVEYCGECLEETSSAIGSSVTGTIVSLVVGIKKHPPLIDMSIVPEVPGYLYALFDYGLTLYILKTEEDLLVQRQVDVCRHLIEIVWERNGGGEEE